MNKSDLTAARLRDLLDYDPQTGAFIWRRNCARAGHTDKRGYVYIQIDGRSYGAHRLAWLYVHGVWPGKMIDHGNAIKNDNRIANLEDVTNARNMQNIRAANSNSSSGYRGVCLVRSGRWQADITRNGRKHWLGYFATALDAHAAYVRAKGL